MSGAAARSTALALRSAGRADPIELKPDHVHDAGVIDPKTRALPVQIEVDNKSGQLLDRPDRNRHHLHGQDAEGGGGASRCGADGSRAGRTSSCRSAARGSRADSSRWCHATRDIVGIKSGVKPWRPRRDARRV